MRRLAVVAILLVTSCSSFLAQAHTISLAFKTGDTYKYALHVVLDYTVGAQGLSIPLQLDLTAKDGQIGRRRRDRGRGRRAQ